MTGTQQYSNTDFEYLQLLRWRSRRGLLELELLLLPFAAERLEQLGSDDLRSYERLLGCEDLDIYDWLQQRCTPQDPDLVEIVAAIRQHHASRAG